MLRAARNDRCADFEKALVAQVIAANELYDKMRVHYNFFQPVMHLVEKTVILEDGKPVRVKRRHDQARTPFDRLCATSNSRFSIIAT